jgi:flagellar motor switch protein FliG
VQSESLIDFLWYMADAELAKKIFRTMPQRASEMLFEDLEVKYGRLNPDTATVAQVEVGRAAILELIKIFDQLVDEGKLLNI